MFKTVNATNTQYITFDRRFDSFIFVTTSNKIHMQHGMIPLVSNLFHYYGSLHSNQSCTKSVHFLNKFSKMRDVYYDLTILFFILYQPISHGYWIPDQTEHIN